MDLNPGYIVNITPLMPQGTNSTMFTECCTVAICDDEACCPGCGKNVIGYDADSEHERHRIRWTNATRYWKRWEKGQVAEW